jgi:hypothetical protein
VEPSRALVRVSPNGGRSEALQLPKDNLRNRVPSSSNATECAGGGSPCSNRRPCFSREPVLKNCIHAELACPNDSLLPFYSQAQAAVDGSDGGHERCSKAELIVSAPDVETHSNGECRFCIPPYR